MRAIRFVSTLVYGTLTVLIVLFPQLFTTGWYATIAEWWALVTTTYVILQLMPIVSMLYGKPFAKATWEWRWGGLDAWSSYVLAAIVFLGIPLMAFWVLGTGFNYWSWKIWWFAIFAAKADVMIAMIEAKLEKLAP